MAQNAHNELNQHTTNTWWGSVTVVGVANITSGTVTVNGQPGVLRADKTFVATNLPVVAGTNEYMAVLTDVFGRAGTNRVTVVAKDRAFGYDANGNLTNDGELVYVWDEADRLVDVHKGGEVVMMCRYDGLSRRRERVMNGITNRYVYHDAAVGGAGWLVVEVRDGANDVLENYTHGPDLSGSLGGAGGIGGILSVTHPGATNATYFYHYDGNGNVVRLTDTNGAGVSTLDYTPFGRVLASPGPCTPRCQFSTKEYDGVVGLNYYGFRYYSPELGRWMSRDPLGEHVFRMIVLQAKTIGDDSLNHLFVLNDPLSRFDFLGLEMTSICCAPGTTPYLERYCPVPLKPMWELAGYSSAVDCARKLCGKANEPITECLIGGGLIGLCYPPVGIGIGVGLACQYAIALDQCSQKMCPEALRERWICLSQAGNTPVL